MKRLLLLLSPVVAFAAAPVTDWSPNLTLTSAWQNNVTNGEAVWDRIGTFQFAGDLLASSQYDLGHYDALHATFHLGGDWLPRFLALDRGLLGGRLDWEHTFGRNPNALVSRLEVAGDGVMAGERSRRGAAGSATLRVQKKFGTAWHAAIQERLDRFDANNAVFDNRSEETAIEISRDLNDTTRVKLTGSWRDGDVVTYAQYHRPDLVAIARANALLTTFHQPMTAYATKAQTVAGRLALDHAITEEAAIELAVGYAQTNRTGLKFANQIFSLSLIRQF